MGSTDVEYYGGYLVAESVTPANADLIVRAVNAYEPLREALQCYLESCDCVKHAGEECGNCNQARAALDNCTAPACGHSACRQNWIDTGYTDCVWEDA